MLRRNGQWLAFYIGNEGKKRLADDIVIPKQTSEQDVVGVVADICHEWARPNHNDVTIISD